MRRPLLALALIGIIMFPVMGLAITTAQDMRTYLDVTGLADGDYHLKIVDGAVTVHPIKVLKVGDTPDPPDPPTNDLKALVEVTKTALAAVNDRTKEDTKTKLAGVYKLVAALPVGTKDNYKKALDPVRTAALTQLGRERQWADFVTATDAELDKLPDARFASGLSAVAEVLNGDN